MGRIKSTMIKRAAHQMLKEENKFNGDFEHNKALLRGTMPSKSVRNKVAGFIGHVIRMKEKEINATAKKVSAS